MISFVNRVHDRVVHSRRVEVLNRHLSSLLPAGAKIVDVGCGDGLLASRIAATRPDCEVRGIDVLVRPDAHIPVMHFDGVHIPAEDQSVDVVMFVDVLHHTHDPMPLLSEARRVARQGIVIKDHLSDGLLSPRLLRLMDWVGNAHHGVALPYNYWTRAQWSQSFDQLKLDVDAWTTRLGLYPGPANWVFGRSLHFIARLIPGGELGHAG